MFHYKIWQVNTILNKCYMSLNIIFYKFNESNSTSSPYTLMRVLNFEFII